MSNKFLSVEEFAAWSERHTPQEVEQMAIEQQAQLRNELLESAGITLEEYQAAPRMPAPRWKKTVAKFG